MNKLKNLQNNLQKNNIITSLNSRTFTSDQNQSINLKDKINIVLGDKIKELQNILKLKKDHNNQLINQLKSLSDKANELVSKRNKFLISINQQKSQIFVIKNKNRAYRNYLSELTSRDCSEAAKNKKEENTFNSIAKLSENISVNITEINAILSNNMDKLKINQNDLLKNIPVEFLKKLGNNNVNK